MAAKEQKSKTASSKAAPAATKPATRRTTTTTKAKAKPKVDTPPLEITVEMIAERAYFLSLMDDGSDDVGNWLRAEAELRG